MSLGMMSASELTVVGTEGDRFIYVTAPYGSNGFEWPTKFDWRGARFKFVCNEPILRDMDAGGHAKYEMVQRTCGQCGGKGYVETPAMRCACCGGKGVIEVGSTAQTQPEPTRSQKLAAAGYTRRATWRSLPCEE